MKDLHEVVDAIVSYFAAALAFFVSLPLMKIGGAVLLIARLIVDIPPAFAKIKSFLHKP